MGLLAVGAYGLWGVRQSEQRFRNVQDNTFPAIKALTDARSTLNSGRMATFLHVSTFQAAQKERIGQRIANEDMEMDHALTGYRQTLMSGAADGALLSADDAALTVYRSAREPMLEKSANKRTGGEVS